MNFIINDKDARNWKGSNILDLFKVAEESIEITEEEVKDWINLDHLTSENNASMSIGSSEEPVKLGRFTLANDAPVLIKSSEEDWVNLGILQRARPKINAAERTASGKEDRIDAGLIERFKPANSRIF